MLWTVVVATCLATLLPQGSCYPSRYQWIDPDDLSFPQELLDDPSWRQDNTKELGDELVAQKRALSVLSRWRPFSETFKSSGRPIRGQMISEFLPHGVELVSAETRGNLRPHGQPLRWGRR